MEKAIKGSNHKIEKISFIIPTYRSSKDLRIYLDTFLQYNSPEGISFYIIDTSEESDLLKVEKDYLNKLKIKVYFIPNKGYGFACNYGFKHAKKSKIYIFSNPDIIFNSNIVDKIKEEFDENMYGTVIQKDKNLKKCTFNLYPQYRNFFTEVINIKKFLNWVNFYNPKYIMISGAFMIVGRQVIIQNGLFDENFFLYYEDDDFFYRLRKNRNFRIIKDRFIIHNISSNIDRFFGPNKFNYHADSLYYYSHKYNNFNLIRNLIFIYKITSLFIPKHRSRLVCLLEKYLQH